MTNQRKNNESAVQNEVSEEVIRQEIPEVECMCCMELFNEKHIKHSVCPSCTRGLEQFHKAQMDEKTKCSIRDCPYEANTQLFLTDTGTLVCKDHRERIGTIIDRMLEYLAELRYYGIPYEGFHGAYLETTVEICEDCRENEEITINGMPFGGFDRPLCADCRTKEMARIDNFCDMYGTDKNAPDMRVTLTAWRYREQVLEEADEMAYETDAIMDAAKYQQNGGER